MAPNACDKFSDFPGLVISATAPTFCMPTHVDPALSVLAIIACLDEQDLIDEESLSNQELTFWPPYVHLWQPPSSTRCGLTLL